MEWIFSSSSYLRSCRAAICCKPACCGASVPLTAFRRAAALGAVWPSRLGLTPSRRDQALLATAVLIRPTAGETCCDDIVLHSDTMLGRLLASLVSPPPGRAWQRKVRHTAAVLNGAEGRTVLRRVIRLQRPLLLESICWTEKLAAPGGPRSGMGGWVGLELPLGSDGIRGPSMVETRKESAP